MACSTPSSIKIQTGRSDRLAELVVALTGCGDTDARHVVRGQVTRSERTFAPADPLDLVARAMIELDRPEPSGFRVAGYLRDDLTARQRSPRMTGRPLPMRVAGGLPHRRPVQLSA